MTRRFSSSSMAASPAQAIGVMSPRLESNSPIQDMTKPPSSTAMRTASAKSSLGLVEQKSASFASASTLAKRCWRRDCASSTSSARSPA